MGAPDSLVARAEGRQTNFAVQHAGQPAGSKGNGKPLFGQVFAAPHRRRAQDCTYNPAAPLTTRTRVPLATRSQLSSFLAEIERRAFKQAMYAVRNEDAALDVVQDAMLKLTEKYADRPAEELPLLFQRILQNAVYDHFRRSKVRSTWTVLLSAFGAKDDKDDDYDPLETLRVKSDSSATLNPSEQLEQRQVFAQIEDALAKLPARQRQAFLLRYWEEFDVAETAAAMGCSEGSVKTHCSRAVRALAVTLEAAGVRL